MNQAGEDRRLVLVYNADAGFFNAVMDAAHKLLSPGTYDCRLCALTYGAWTMKKPWAAFLDCLAIPVKFLHRDEFRKNHPHLTMELPAIFLEHNSDLRLLVDAATLNRQSNLNELTEILSRAASESACS